MLKKTNGYLKRQFADNSYYYNIGQLSVNFLTSYQYIGKLFGEKNLEASSINSNSRTKNKKEASTMEHELPKIRSVHMTNLYLSVPENLTKFLHEFRQILKDNFQVIIVEGEKRYTCGQEHTRENPNWEPFKHFEPYCLENGLDDFEVRDFLDEYLGRPIICECDILIDRREHRKRDLSRVFGLDFEGCDLVD